MRGHEPPRPLDEHGLLDRCREHGVALLQIGDNLPLDTFDAARLSKLAERAAKEGVELEIGARGLTRENVAQYARIAHCIGAKLIRFVIDDGAQLDTSPIRRRRTPSPPSEGGEGRGEEGRYIPESPLSPALSPLLRRGEREKSGAVLGCTLDDAGRQPTPEAVVAVLRDVVSELHGLTLGIENHDRFSAATLRSILEAAGSDRIGICLDTANSLGSGEGVEAVAAILAPFTVNLHLKDFAIERVPWQMGFSVQGRPAGEGMLDIPSLLRQVAAFGRCETAVLELWTPPESRIEETIAKEARWAEQSLQYLKQLFS